MRTLNSRHHFGFVKFSPAVTPYSLYVAVTFFELFEQKSPRFKHFRLLSSYEILQEAMFTMLRWNLIIFYDTSLYL